MWLGLHNTANYAVDFHDEQKLKDFMALKYEKKRFYVAPTQDMHQEARKLNTPPQAAAPTRTLRPMGQGKMLQSVNTTQVKAVT